MAKKDPTELAFRAAVMRELDVPYSATPAIVRSLRMGSNGREMFSTYVTFRAFLMDRRKMRKAYADRAVRKATDAARGALLDAARRENEARARGAIVISPPSEFR